MSQENASSGTYSFYDFTDGFSDGASFTGDVMDSIAKGQSNLAQTYDQIADALHKDISRMHNLAYGFSERALLAGDTAAASAYQKLADGYKAMADTRLVATSEAFVKSIAANADAMTSAGIGKLGGAAGNLVGFGAGMHAFATAGDATALGETIAGIAAGAFGAWAFGAGLALLGVPAGIGLGIAAALVGIGLGKLAGDYFGGAIGDAVNDLFNTAASFIPFADPLTLDLDGDGLETVGIDPESPILFDHDGDGVKTATGWVNADDGFLVLDRNGNGSIDTGAELFGDSTPLTGQAQALPQMNGSGQVRNMREAANDGVWERVA